MTLSQVLNRLEYEVKSRFRHPEPSDETDKVFRWLVKYHAEINFNRWINYARINDAGTGLVSKSGFDLVEGEGENKYVKGHLILATGTDIVDRLKSSGLVSDKSLTDSGHIIVGTPKIKKIDKWENNLESSKDFLNYVERQLSPDASYILDVRKNRIIKFHEFDNTLWTPHHLGYYVPKDFISTKKFISIDNEASATKTKNAIRVAVFYGLNTYQLKATPFGNTGTGKVTHFDLNGLVKEFFLLYHPKSNGPFIDNNLKIVGVLRKYRTPYGTPSKENGFLAPSQVMLVDSNLGESRIVERDYVQRVLKGY